MNYFNKIPTIVYNGQVSKNLLARAKLSDRTMKNKMAFYPYTMDETDRADTLSQHYYENPGYTWLIWMANGTIDPYYSMPLTEQDFYNYMVDKYGSIEKAMRKIAFYRIKYDNQTKISVSEYKSKSPQFTKYYEPVLDRNGTITNYVRKLDIDTTSTNKIITLELSTVNQNFTVGEEIQVDGTNYAFITCVEGNIITCQHVNGSFSTDDLVVGKESGASGIVVSSTTITETIAFTDIEYWEPVTYFDHERELNENKKYINLLDARYKGQVETELKRLMSIN
jgi:hypothetical protein